MYRFNHVAEAFDNACISLLGEVVQFARSVHRIAQCGNRGSGQYDVPDRGKANDENSNGLLRHGAKLPHYLRSVRIIDTHTHLYQPTFDEDREAAMQRCTEVGVETLLLPNIDAASIPRVHEMMDCWPDRCFGMMGLHPCHVKPDSWQSELKTIREQIDHSGRRYVAIGEIGFDLHWDKTTLDIQHVAFRKQVEWAKELKLPIVIHVREAFDALFEALDEVNDEALTGVVHCFTGNVEQAQRILDYGGFYLGIGGVATYKNGGLDAVLPHVPHDRVVLETDSPYLSPVPHRGKRNESSYTAIVAQCVADLWQLPIERAAAVTTANAERLFSLPFNGSNQ